MKIDNPLCREFLMDYSEEAARVLEQVSVEHVAALLTELSPSTGAPVMAKMLPERASACLAKMTATSAARLVAELPLSTAARIYRLMAPAKRDEISSQLADKVHRRILRHLEYPPECAGAMLDPRVDMLPENIAVAEAIRRIEHLDHSVACEIFVVNSAHQLIGAVDLGTLVTADHHARVSDIMKRKTQFISAHATAAMLIDHPGWKSRRWMPVVERDSTLVGVLDYQYLRESVATDGTIRARDPMENLLSLAGLYWLSVAQLLDSLLGMSARNKGERR